MRRAQDKPRGLCLAPNTTKVPLGAKINWRGAKTIKQITRERRAFNARAGSAIASLQTKESTPPGESQGEWLELTDTFPVLASVVGIQKPVKDRERERRERRRESTSTLGEPGVGDLERGARGYPTWVHTIKTLVRKSAVLRCR